MEIVLIVVSIISSYWKYPFPLAVNDIQYNVCMLEIVFK